MTDNPTYTIPDYCGGELTLTWDMLTAPDAREVIMAEMRRRLAARQEEEDEAMEEHEELVMILWQAWRDGLVEYCPEMLVPRWMPREVRLAREFLACLPPEVTVPAVRFVAMNWEAYTQSLTDQNLWYGHATPSPSVTVLVREPAALVDFHRNELREPVYTEPDASEKLYYLFPTEPIQRAINGPLLASKTSDVPLTYSLGPEKHGYCMWYEASPVTDQLASDSKAGAKKLG